jgi:c(7)-type cytochrome triheme protein
VLLGALAAALALAPPAVTAPVFPDEFIFKEGKFSPGPVTFSHKFHYEKIGQCQACHLQIFRVRKDVAVMTFKNISAGKYCGACHNGRKEIGGKVIFDAHEKRACGRCHQE